MYVLGKAWADGYLDYSRSPDEVRVGVRAWCPLAALDDIHFAQPRNLRRLWNYVTEIGVSAVVRKARSRLAETYRDRRFLAMGVGEIIEGGEQHGYSQGTPVLFIAPNHPACVERIVLPKELVCAIDAEEYARLCQPNEVHLFKIGQLGTMPGWDAIGGWSKYSGQNIADVRAGFLNWARQEIANLCREKATMLPLAENTPICERSDLGPAQKRGLSAVLFGLGNYAKINIIPNLNPQIRLDCIHEIDPTQIGRIGRQGVTIDTYGSVRANEKYDVYLIAGYHSTHADLAIHALQQGACAVVEKPLVISREQASRLMDAVREHPGRLFACFQMRYSPLWDLARTDMQIEPGQPIHYHCIVYEVPLPRRHWYNWPDSASRLVSNGCHWLDHFLFMNDYAMPVRHDVWKGGNGDLHVSAELENGAVFGMVLTDEGSERIGVQEHIELRANGVTVSVRNSGQYASENRHKIIRRSRINKYSLYSEMYQNIFRRIVDGRPGDSLQSVERTSGLMVDLEDSLGELRG